MDLKWQVSLLIEKVVNSLGVDVFVEGEILEALNEAFYHARQWPENTCSQNIKIKRVYKLLWKSRAPWKGEYGIVLHPILTDIRRGRHGPYLNLQWRIKDFPDRCANLVFGNFFCQKMNENERNCTKKRRVPVVLTPADPSKIWTWKMYLWSS